MLYQIFLFKIKHDVTNAVFLIFCYTFITIKTISLHRTLLCDSEQLLFNLGSFLNLLTLPG